MMQRGRSAEPNAPSIDHEGSGDLHAESWTRRGRPSLEEAQRLPSRILEAGWEVLTRHGFENFTFDRIARHARIGKVTIYNRFPGKPEFLTALLKFKVDERRMSILAESSNLPLIERFCRRAAAAVEILLSPEGMMLERLVDWCDQELSDDNVNYRQTMYQDSLLHIANELQLATEEEGFVIDDVALAARFWVEGLLGHTRFVGNVQNFDRQETERWARSYSEFFFSAWRL